MRGGEERSVGWVDKGVDADDNLHWVIDGVRKGGYLGIVVGLWVQYSTTSI